MKTDMTLIAFAPGIHVLTRIVITTQKLNTIKPNQIKKEYIMNHNNIFILILIHNFMLKKLKKNMNVNKKKKRKQ